MFCLVWFLLFFNMFLKGGGVILRFLFNILLWFFCVRFNDFFFEFLRINDNYFKIRLYGESIFVKKIFYDNCCYFSF